MGASHDHSHDDSATSERRLWIALALTASFLLVEVAASLVTGSTREKSPNTSCNSAAGDGRTLRTFTRQFALQVTRNLAEREEAICVRRVLIFKGL